MTTHPRARRLGAGVVMTLSVGTVAAGVLALAPSPAMAADPSVQIVNVNGTLTSGERTDLAFTVTNNNQRDGGQAGQGVAVRVTTSFGELRCEGRCDFNDAIAPGETKSFTVALVAGTVEPTKTKSGKVRIQAEIGGDEAAAERDMTVRGPDQAASAKEISGKVRDQDTGSPVAGATVAMTDKDRHQYVTATDGSGNYKFVAAENRPITPGEVWVGVQKENFKQVMKSVKVAGGQAAKLDLTLKATAAPSPTATPTVTPEATPEATDTAEALAPPSVAAAAPLKPAADSSGTGSWLFILLGGLLVAAGVGAIVLVLMRRKDNDAQADAAAPAGAAAAATGVYGGPAAGRPGPDATMVAGAVPASLADAPTMLQRAVPANPADEFPDPYGLPPVGQPPAYGAAAPPTGGWAQNGAPATGAAGAAAVNSSYRPAGPPPPAYGSPVAPGGGYGAPPAPPEAYGNRDYPPPPEPTGYPAAGGYAERYDEPTGRYEPPAGGYPPQGRGAAGAYPPPGAPGGYPAEPSYPAGGGYEPDGGYPTGGRYGGPPTGGYEPAPPQGYEPASPQGYEPAPPQGYEPAPPQGYPPTGYPAPPPGGYEQPSGRGGAEHNGSYGGPEHNAGYGGPERAGGYGGAERPGYRDNQPGGYDRPPAQPGGYEHGGYYGEEQGQPPARHGAPPPAQAPGGQPRRPLDWLDD